MDKLNIKLILTCVIFLLVSFSAASAQNPNNFDEKADGDQTVRLNFLRELGLSREQIQKIRILNSERAPLMMEAQKALREATRNLDQAIYADSIDESVVQNRLNEVQIARNEVFKIRAMSEFEIRKVLTPEQLTRFRELRDRFNNRNAAIQKRIQNRQQQNQNRQNDADRAGANSTPAQNNRQKP